MHPRRRDRCPDADDLVYELGACQETPVELTSIPAKVLLQRSASRLEVGVVMSSFVRLSHDGSVKQRNDTVGDEELIVRSSCMMGSSAYLYDIIGFMVTLCIWHSYQLHGLRIIKASTTDQRDDRAEERQM